MVTFLSGGTGTPKLLAGMADRYAPGELTVVANTGDDVELGGLLVCPDLDTVLYLASDLLDTDTWWGIEGDTAETHDHLQDVADAVGIEGGPRYLDEAAQRTGRRIARWRRFSGVAEFMHIGDRDRAVHVTRTGLIDEGRTLTEAIGTLANSLDAPWRILPMSDDPVATIVRTPEGPMHFQEFWVWHDGEPGVEGVEFRGSADATATDAVREALAEPVVIGPSNPVTSIGPILAVDGIRRALESTPVVAVSPFVEDRVFSGPADKLMRAVGYEASTRGVAAAYPFADAFVLDEDDGTSLDHPVRRTDTEMSTSGDAARVGDAVEDALAEVAG